MAINAKIYLKCLNSRLKCNFSGRKLVIILTVLSLPSICLCQEYSYYSEPGLQNDSNDSEPETHVEDVALPALDWNRDVAPEILPNFTYIPQITNVSSESAIPVKQDVRVSCLKTPRVNATVEVLNGTSALMNALFTNPEIKSKTVPSNCTVVFFYARWCPFSANAAPHFNALPRLFPSVRTLAIDATQHTSANTYFGIMAVPSVILFRNGKMVAKFNESTPTLARFVDFFTTWTDLEASPQKVNVTSEDFEGPLPSTPVKEFDLYLYLAWIFIGLWCVSFTRNSHVFKTIIEFVRRTWREAEDQHEHPHQE